MNDSTFSEPRQYGLDASNSLSSSSQTAHRFRPYPSTQHHVTKGRYITSNDPRGYIPVYEYPLNGQWIMMDVDDGYILWTGIWKALGNAKADIVKMIESQPELAPQLRRVRGGYLKIQGTWMPHEVAVTLSRRVAWPIRDDLVPFFGPQFPTTCLSPEQPGYGQVIPNPGGRRKGRRNQAAAQQAKAFAQTLQRPASSGDHNQLTLPSAGLSLHAPPPSNSYSFPPSHNTSEFSSYGGAYSHQSPSQSIPVSHENMIPPLSSHDFDAGFRPPSSHSQPESHSSFYELTSHGAPSYNIPDHGLHGASSRNQLYSGLYNNTSYRDNQFHIPPEGSTVHAPSVVPPYMLPSTTSSPSSRPDRSSGNRSHRYLPYPNQHSASPYSNGQQYESASSESGYVMPAASYQFPPSHPPQDVASNPAFSGVRHSSSQEFGTSGGQRVSPITPKDNGLMLPPLGAPTPAHTPTPSTDEKGRETNTTNESSDSGGYHLPPILSLETTRNRAQAHGDSAAVLRRLQGDDTLARSRRYDFIPAEVNMGRRRSLSEPSHPHGFIGGADSYTLSTSNWSSAIDDASPWSAASGRYNQNPANGHHRAQSSGQGANNPASKYRSPGTSFPTSLATSAGPSSIGSPSSPITPWASEFSEQARSDRDKLQPAIQIHPPLGGLDQASIDGPPGSDASPSPHAIDGLTDGRAELSQSIVRTNSQSAHHFRKTETNSEGYVVNTSHGSQV